MVALVSFEAAVVAAVVVEVAVVMMLLLLVTVLLMRVVSFPAALTVSFVSSFTYRFTFFAIRSFLVSSKWLGKWLMILCRQIDRKID